MFNKSKHPFWYHMFKSVLKVLDAVTPIVTLGLYYSEFEYEFTAWYFGKYQ